VTDITYIRTWQGWLYLAVVESFFSSLKKERIKKRIYKREI
jgi:transposase InsO family protein